MDYSGEKKMSVFLGAATDRKKHKGGEMEEEQNYDIGGELIYMLLLLMQTRTFSQGFLVRCDNFFEQ